jgi:predicted MFS family arabinose efflux permease
MLPHRHFDLAGATSVTAGLMLLVYALTRATNDGWGATTTLALLTSSVALLLAFVAIELRSRAPLLPLRIFRLRALSAANATIAVVGAGAFSEFFLLTLYMQDVLGFTPVQTGAAFAALALAAVVASNLVQAVVGRIGVRPVLTSGLLALSLSVALLSRVPVEGHYFWDLFPAFLLGGAGLGVSFVSATIGGLTGVRPSDSGVASGLVNTSRQIGGAIGLAAISAVAAASAGSYADSHPDVQASSALALTHGFQISFYVLTGVLLFGALIAATLLKPRPPSLEAERAYEQQPEPVREAA